MTHSTAPDAREAHDENGVYPDIEFLLGIKGSTQGDKQVFRIGDLSREFGVTLRTLRFYEDRGLLNPERRGTTRLYSRRDRVRLRLVLLAKLLGFSLTEARQIIDLYQQPNGKRRQMEYALERFTEQKRVLIEQKQELTSSLKAMDASIAFLQSRLANSK